MRNVDYPHVESRGISEFFDWVKLQSHQFRGVTFGTMLRDEGYQFIRLGTFMERADNTARIVDVKYHTLLPSAADVGGAVDYYQWSALLRSVSAFDSYRKVYRDVITPMKVAELLILRDDVPRSLHACMNEIYDILRGLCDDTQLEAERTGRRTARQAALRAHAADLRPRPARIPDGISRRHRQPRRPRSTRNSWCRSIRLKRSMQTRRHPASIQLLSLSANH